jgi:small subunit ribosomal protein S5
MTEYLDEAAAIESTTVGVYRTAATVKGGRRFSFSAMVVVGDRGGSVGIGYGKADQVPPAIEKAQKEARRKMRRYPLIGRTIPHAVTGRFGACTVRLLPASPGTGVIAGAAVRAPLEMLGVQDCLTKSFGSSNTKNLVKAVIDGLDRLRAKETVEHLRGTELEKTMVEEAVERGQAYIEPPRAAEPAADHERSSRPAESNGKSKKPRSKSRPDRKGGSRSDQRKRRPDGRGRDQRKPESKAPEDKPPAPPPPPAETAEQREAPAAKPGEPAGAEAGSDKGSES